MDIMKTLGVIIIRRLWFVHSIQGFSYLDLKIGEQLKMAAVVMSKCNEMNKPRHKSGPSQDPDCKKKIN